MRTRLPFRSTSVIASLLERDMVSRGWNGCVVEEIGLRINGSMANRLLSEEEMCNVDCRCDVNAVNSEPWWGHQIL